MRITARIISLILISSFVLGGIHFSQPATAAVSTDSFAPVPGDTVWYTVDSFYVDLEFLSDGKINDTYMTTTLDLSGSQLFAKVMDVYQVDGEQEDPATGVKSPATSDVVDLSVGAILGTDLPFRYENFSTTVPAGVGVPVPYIFMAYTELGFYASDYGDGFFPLFLSDNWATHEAFFANGDATVTNDAAQFKVEGSDAFYDNNGTHQLGEVQMSLAWDKSNNALSSAVFSITNSTLGETYVDIKINFDKIENIGLDLEVDDKFSFTITEGVLDMSFSGDFDTPEVRDVYGNATEALDNATRVDTLVEMTVNKVQGLYYLVSVRQWNETLGAMETVGDFWFAGFGRLDFSMTKEGGPNLLNQVVVTGPAVTPDNYIWGSWDASISYLFAVLEQSFADLVVDIRTAAGEDESIISFDLTADLSLSHTTDTTNGYTYSSSADVHIISKMNSTYDKWVDYYYDNETGEWVDVYETYWTYTEFELSLSLESSVTYDSRGRLSTISETASGFLDIYEVSNDTYSESIDGRITLNNFTIVVDSQFTPATPESDTVSSQVDTSSTVPNPLPGFEFYLSILSLAIVVVAVRRRQH